MAKRNPNDRNAVAILKAARAAQPGTWTSEDGRVIQLKKADMVFVQMATASVEFPDEPTYTVKVGKREEEYPIDELVIEQTTDPTEKLRLLRAWQKYQTDLGMAYSELSKRGTAAIIYEGTVPNAEMVENDRAWHKKMRVTRWKLPTDADELWVLYLQTSLSDDEIASLSEAVARFRGGASEEMISAAEKTFPDDLPDESERSGDVGDTGSDTRAD